MTKKPYEKPEAADVEVEACPFCGQNKIGFLFTKSVQMKCENCGATGPETETLGVDGFHECARKWNERK